MLLFFITLIYLNLLFKYLLFIINYLLLNLLF